MSRITDFFRRRSPGSTQQRAWDEFNKGLAAWGPENRARAEKHFRRAIKLKSDEGTFHMRLAATLEAAGRKQEAKRSYEEAIRLMPDKRVPCFMMGNLLSDLKDIDSAREYYATAMKLETGEVVDYGAAKIERAAASDSETSIVLHGIPPNKAGARIAAWMEGAYIAGQRCQCGGFWALEHSASKYPIATKHCRCETCGAARNFVFRFTES
jgi:tetratricopeptide (TPR) repeat protein